MITPGRTEPTGITFQALDVHKPLTSVGCMADAGFGRLLSKTGSFMSDVDSGELIPLTRRGKLYHVRAWKKAADSSPFGRPRQLVHLEHAESVRHLDRASGAGEATRKSEASSSTTIEEAGSGQEETQEKIRKPQIA